MSFRNVEMPILYFIKKGNLMQRLIIIDFHEQKKQRQVYYW